jgi:hypothetical protein
MFSPTALHRGHGFEGPLIGRIQPRPPQRSQSLSAGIDISDLEGQTAAPVADADTQIMAATGNPLRPPKRAES